MHGMGFDNNVDDDDIDDDNIVFNSQSEILTLWHNKAK